MSQLRDDDNIEQDSSVPDVKDSTKAPRRNSQKTLTKPILDDEVIEEKSFSERWKTNRFWLVRGSYHFLHSVWTIVMFIGGFIVWLISLLFI